MILVKGDGGLSPRAAVVAEAPSADSAPPPREAASPATTDGSAASVAASVVAEREVALARLLQVRQLDATCDALMPAAGAALSEAGSPHAASAVTPSIAAPHATDAVHEKDDAARRLVSDNSRERQASASLVCLPIAARSTPPRPSDVEAFCAEVEGRLPGRVGDLAVAFRTDGAIVLQGRCSSYYVKQVVQHIGMTLLTGGRVVNEIRVYPPR
jgi:hypothetical protein